MLWNIEWSNDYNPTSETPLLTLFRYNDDVYDFNTLDCLLCLRKLSSSLDHNAMPNTIGFRCLF